MVSSNSKHNSIPAQIIIIRHMGESTGVQDQHHRVFINWHAPSSMLTKVEVLSIWYLIALQRHMLITYINFAGVMREDFFSFAWKILFAAQLTRIHTDTHTPLKRAMPFSCLANHSSCTILLNGFSRPGYVCKNVECKTNSQPVKTHSWTERWQAGGAQLLPWGPLCFFSFTNQLFCLCFNWFSIVIKFYSQTPSHVYFLPESAIPLESRSASPINCELYFFGDLLPPRPLLLSFAVTPLTTGKSVTAWRDSNSSWTALKYYAQSWSVLNTTLFQRR